MTNKFFPAADLKKSVNDAELDILAHWKANSVFQRTIDSRAGGEEFVFFDGPPFATGTPHYGHILAGVNKDAIPRYWTMKGYRVERKWGWDCHGLPVEYQVEKEQNIGGKPGIEKMGVAKFNEMCRDIVLRYTAEWEETVDRMGRFVDFKNDYKTMDPEFMESVWWVFKNLWEKGLIYEGHKVVPYSPKLGSPLSNFEANLEYRDIDDPAVTVAFELIDEVVEKPVHDKKTYILAWTTTPWTLPSNIGLGFGKNHQYILVEHEGAYYWIAEDAASRYFKEDFEILARREGKDFFGLQYKPLFDFFSDEVLPEGQNRYMCVHDDGDYVTTDSGTGIVHFSPFYGAEDAAICDKYGLVGINTTDENGYFTESTPPLAGKYFRADKEVAGSKENNVNDWVIKALKDSGQLFKREQYRHSYPHCWRTDCALMYRGITTWFVKVSAIKERMIEHNQKINWTPEHIRDGRFGKILEGAPDWAISRNRYWGTPLPVWRGEKTGTCIAIGSIEELEAKTGKKVDDLHKHFVDDLTWEENGETFHRIEEVLDCWFESGSMPYASKHYPFADEKEVADFKAANFISEGMDQTRGWFYTLHVLGTALFDKPIFDNVICSGIVLAEDGQKMSKSKKNYPDPNIIFNKYGADAMRFYLLQSPVATKGENLRFSEREVEEVLKNLILPLKNAYQFLSLYANIDGWKPTKLSVVRHGEAEHNLENLYSGEVGNQHALTSKGKSQAKAAAAQLKDVDVIITSPFIRTIETAQIIASELGFTGEIIENDLVREIGFGELEGQAYRPLPERMNNPTTEQLPELLSRLEEFVAQVRAQYPGKHVVVVSHGGAIRGIESVINNAKTETEYLSYPPCTTGGVRTYFLAPDSTNDLDQWILSELQTLVKHYRIDFDQYDLEKVCRAIPPFIDKLNNWYLRRNRKRFWAEGLTNDKRMAYATLHYVLVTLSKLLAPICPFFAEHLYLQTLGENGEMNHSVHLETIPFADESQINQSLEDKVNLEREVVSLASGMRARKTIKLRQPLSKLQLAVSESVDTSHLDLETIAAEANVKTVEILDSTEGFAEKVVKVDASKVGRKFGKKMQSIIQAGKSGEFKELEGGRLEIGGEVIEADEYELTFVTATGTEAASSPRVVVILDTEITEVLEREGIARDLIRAIQELRKTSGFDIADRISVHYTVESEKINQAIKEFTDLISGEVLATKITEGAAHDKVEIDGDAVYLSLMKA